MLLALLYVPVFGVLWMLLTAEIIIMASFQSYMHCHAGIVTFIEIYETVFTMSIHIVITIIFLVALKLDIGY